MAGLTSPGDADTLAVVDIGSNSARLVVLQIRPYGHFDIIQDEDASLRLVRSMDKDGRLTREAMQRTLAVIRDFQAIARAAGATRTIAVATSAVREAANGAGLLDQLRTELGFEANIISAKQEARYAFMGAVHGLPVEDGVVVDQGGGSLQIATFRSRRLTRSWSSPLGALRLSAAYLESDPPSRSEQDELVDHVQAQLDAKPMARLKKGQHLIGTGGTIRSLARIDRRMHKYPISRLHGYVLRRERMAAITALVSQADARGRTQIPGLNDERGDSIVAGALVWRTVMERLNARELLVSGQGLREGVAMEHTSTAIPSAREVRAGAIHALCARFATWNVRVARHRVGIALSLLDGEESISSPELAELLEYAATVLDIGRSIDYYNRHEHTAAILTATDMEGFSHRPLALLAAIIERAGGKKAIKAYQPLVTKADEPVIARYGGVLAQADEIQRRCPVEGS